MALKDLLKNDTSAEETPVTVPDDVSDLVESDALTEDPKPAHRTTKSRRRRMTSSPPARKATKDDKDKVRDALTMLYTLPAWSLNLKDPHCGGALLEQRDDIVESLVPLVCRNPRLLAFFTGTDTPWMEWLALGKALTPVGTAIYRHHVKGMPVEGGPAGDFSAYGAPAV